MLTQPQLKYRPFARVPKTALPDRTWPDAMLSRAPIWLSTDLRDGNQALIEPMDVARKLRMFQQLVKIGFKEIEVGFPSASQTEFDFIRLLIDGGHVPDDVTLQVLTQARAHLIERTFESLVGARRVIVHLYNAVAPIMRRVVLGQDEDGIVELATTHARQIKELAEARPGVDWRFEYSPEMFSGTELAFSKRVVDAVTAVWAPTPERKCIVNLPSTVEHSTPNIFADMIEWMHRHLDRRESIVLSVHPHNDRGTGTAAAEFALMAGADRVEGCLFGNGERTGNVDLVNIALNLYTQGVDPQLDFSDIDDVRRCVEHCTQIPVHPRHPYVGDLVYTSFSGSHQDAIKKAFAARQAGEIWDMPYLPIDPKDLGRSYDAVIRVNSQSGKGGMAYLLEAEYGLELPRRLQIEFSQVVQRVMDDAGKELSAADLYAIFEREYAIGDSQASVLQPQMSEQPGGGMHVSAEVVLGDWVGRVQGEGNGPIEAFVNALGERAGIPVRVLDYHEHAIGSGADARAVAYLELRVGEETRHGVGIDGSIVRASMQAILSGLRRTPAFAMPHQQEHTTWTEKLIIFDTTLRDGEQSPGASMTREEKLRIARQLERMRVDVIEAGFPASSAGDFEAVRAIAAAVKDSAVCGLARANDRDISRAAEALQAARHARIHTFIATSELHMEKKLRMTREQVLEQATLAVRFARNLCGDIEFSPEDGYRSDIDFLARVCEAVIQEGAGTINIPDTVGYAIPELYGDFIRRLREKVPNSDQAIWSVHCHNDLGMAVANSLAGVKIGGARQVECTINGLGERAGNCSLEEVVMAVRTRRDHFGLDVGIDATQIVPASKLVSQTTGFVVQPNKAVVGANAFAHASGIHQDGVLKARDTYEIMRAEDVGWAANKIVLGKLSGRNAFKQRLQELGIPLESETEVNAAFQRFKDLADRKNEIFDEDIIALVMDESVIADDEHYRLLSLSQRSETGERPHAAIVFAVGHQEHRAESDGNGPVDATLRAIESVVQSHAEMVLYSVNAITGGSTESQGEVTVRLQHAGRVVNGVGADPDIIVASAKAYLSALNKLQSKAERVAAQG